jgi:hypothetical protein
MMFIYLPKLMPLHALVRMRVVIFWGLMVEVAPEEK